MKRLFLMLCLLLPNLAQAVEVEDLQCLTDTVYFEARSEPIIGQALVAQTVINRMRDRRWPNTICKVVYQDKQYSWTDYKRKPVGELLVYKQIQDMVFIMLSTVPYGDPTGVNHYLRCDYRDKVTWWKSMTFAGRIGAHCFYIDKP